MVISTFYRQRARECLEMAKTSTDVFVTVALTELAEEFGHAADEAEEDVNRGVNHNEVGRRASDRPKAASSVGPGQSSTSRVYGSPQRA